MADRDTKGTDSDAPVVDGGWYVVQEAECRDSLDDFESLFEGDTDGSDISNLLDDNVVSDGEQHLRVFNEQVSADDAQQTLELKRKYLTPSPKSKYPDLSPRLASITISPCQSSSKRRLFEDSGVGSIVGNEIEDNIEGAQAQVNAAASTDEDALYNTDLLRSSKSLVSLFANFKEAYGIGLKELMRPFRSSKTCSYDWVVCVNGAREEVIEGSKTLLQQHCTFFQVNVRTGCKGFLALYLLSFKSGKCKTTLTKLLMSILSVSELQLYIDPPRNRSVPVALFFYQKGMAGDCFKYGDYPDWLASQVLVTHQSKSETFELAGMVQWAYDNKFVDESEIAYHYAQRAEEDTNAAAWLKHNSQAKFVRDCSQMVKLYLRQEMRQTTMPEWIWKCCQSVEGEGDWGVIMRLLKYQNVNFVHFLSCLRHCLEGRPKKTCLVFVGPPNTGKSYFCFSLLNFLQGKVISLINTKSQFFLMPLLDCKIGFMDDVTYPGWTFLDNYMRNGLDGNPISVDCKHRLPVQMKLPPLLMTSNIDVLKEERLRYLHSRLQVFEFPNVFPLTPFNDPVYSLTHCSWKSFFQKLHKQLGLPGPPESEDGESE
nr:early protein 1 [Felis catus papillomavirus]